MTQREPSDAEVDAAFDEIVAHLGDASPDARTEPPSEPATEPTERPASSWRVVEFTTFPSSKEKSDDHPARQPEPDEPLEGPVIDPVEAGWRSHRLADPDDVDDPDQAWAEVPRDPLPPWRPAAATIGAFALITAATVVTLLVVIGVVLPWWASWGALVAVLAAAALLLSRIPRDRDDSDDGARV